MSWLVWAFAGRTYHIVGNLMSQLKYVWIDRFNVIDKCDEIDSRCYEWQLCCDRQFAFNRILL